MLEITIPGFDDLDTIIQSGRRKTTLRDVCFELTDENGNNIFIDIDNSNRCQDTVFQVQKDNKDKTISVLEKWIKTHFHIQVQWNKEHQYEAKTHRLDPQSRTLANQLSELANSTNQKPPPVPKSSNNIPNPPRSKPTSNQLMGRSH